MIDRLGSARRDGTRLAANACRLALLLAALFAAPALAQCNGDPDCLFSTNFNELADWSGCSQGNCTAGRTCLITDWGTAPDNSNGTGCFDHPIGPDNCVGCDPVPDNWSVYLSSNLTGGVPGKTCVIGSETAAGLPDWTGDGKMLIHRVGRNTGNSANNCDLAWWDADEQWQELWTAYSFRADPAAKEFFATPLDGSNDKDMKHVRIGHYKGDGNNSPINFWNFNLGSPYSHTHALVNLRKNGPQDDVLVSMNARCYDTYRSGDCEPRQWQDEIPNFRGIRECANEPNNPFMAPIVTEPRNVRTCAPAVPGSDLPGAQLDTTQCTNDTTCTDGALIPDGSFGQVAGDGWDHYMAGSMFDGNWHTIYYVARINNPIGAGNGSMEIWFDDIKIAELTGIPFLDPGTDPAGTFGTPPTGWNWVMLGGNTRGTWPTGNGLPDEINFTFDNWCIGSTRESVENCHKGFLGQEQTPQCSDGRDNDGDGLADDQDPGCASPEDTSERGTTICDDGQDNDGDGLADAADAGCSGPTDGDESNCGDGVASGGEVCDGADLGGQSCLDFGFAFAGGLSCQSACNGYDTAACSNDAPVAASLTFDEVDDYISIADSPDLTLPNGPWTVGIFARSSELTGQLFQYAVSNNSTDQPNSLNVILEEAGGAWAARAVDGDGTEVLLQGRPLEPSGDFRMIVFRRDDDVDLLSCTAVGGCSIEDSASTLGFGAIDGGNWELGRRADANPDRYFGGELGHFFIVKRALNDAELALAARNLDGMAGVAEVYLAGDLQIDRTGNGHDGTPIGGPLPSLDGPPFGNAACGNGVIDFGEQCDASNLDGQTCLSIGYGQGVLGCSGGCLFDTSECSGAPPAPADAGRLDTSGP